MAFDLHDRRSPRGTAAPLARFTLLAATIALAPPARASEYSLVTPPSSLEAGCFGPCDCAVVTQPTYGSFDLAFTGADPLFAHYAITGYIASFNSGPGAVAVTGTGEFKLGGEVALEQEMTLDLSVWGGPVQHFDSGLVPVGAAFPSIDVRCALHGFACLDSVVEIDATPVDPASVPLPAVRAGIRSIAPNPSRGGADVVLALDRAGEVDVTIVDLLGRRVRTLASARALPAGFATLGWDGADDSGRATRAGVYWVVMRWSGGSDRRRLVRLE
ncbi:MAG TPA: FlgD immunoglobulin-like domain containing protein [Candidatus Acidoferrales bacterium]|nr:FlgD immunoglobulin-like domain containing protein [Candidatus Acidoferrales bacterium]